VGAPSSTTPGTTTPALPPAFGPNGAIQGLPSSKACLSKRHFTIHIRRYAHITYLEAIVFINKKQNKVAKSRNGQFTSPIDLRGFPKGTFVVKITVITSTGGIIVGTRTYHTCHRKITPRGTGACSSFPTGTGACRSQPRRTERTSARPGSWGSRRTRT
jgi:hypothetical protein